MRRRWSTFLVASSGVGFFGVGGAFWGLVAGGAVLAFTRFGALADRAKQITPRRAKLVAASSRFAPQAERRITRLRANAAAPLKW